MKKITIYVLHLGYGGIEQYVSSLCKMLQDDFKIEIISTYKVLDKPAFEFSDKISIKYLINDKPNKEQLINSIKRFKLLTTLKEGFKSINTLYKKYSLNKKSIKELNTDYVITTRIFHNKLVSKYANNKIIKIASDHNYHDDDQNYINEIVKSCNKFDYYIAISKSLHETYQEYFKKTNCVYIPNVIDNISTKNASLNNMTLISIGRLSKEKGFVDLVEVIDIVKKELPNIKLHLIGDGYEKNNINNKIKELNLESNIMLHGYLNKKEIEKYILGSSLYVMSSYTESFGLVLLEAFSFGVPAIAFDSARGARELIDTTNGILIKNRDKNEMAKEIIRLLNDKKNIEQLGKKSKEKSKEYLADNIKEKWLDILK